MTAKTSAASKRRCIVVANDKGSERVSTSLLQRASGSAAAVTMGFLRLAARRAETLSSPANVIVSAQDGDRRSWEGPGAAIRARINRPERCLAKQLISQGAMVASGILLGYAQAFAARINKYWPYLAQELIHTLEKDPAAEVERKFSVLAYRKVPRLAMHSVRLFPPTFPARAFPVQGSGWCSRQFGGI